MPTRRAFLGAAGLLPLAASQPARAAGEVVRAVVAADGSGDFQTVQRAVDHVLDHPPASVSGIVLEIRPGVYKERIKIPQDRPRLLLLGRDAATTVFTFNMSAAAAGGTFFSPAVEVNGAAFEARNITFENTFGVGSQAVALSVHSDRAAFHNCRFLGWQDTLYAAWGRQYYRDCYIAGHVDFIFGNAAAVFDNCQIHSRGSGYLTAHSRTRPDEPTGFVFRQCRLTGEPGLLRGGAPARQPETPYPAQDSGKGVYLGRPWRTHSRVVFLDCSMGGHIRPEGWDNWGNAENEKTAWYAELGSTGPGANLAARAAWARRITPKEAEAFATQAFLKGADGWNPAP
jgi:pectinesterase